MLKNMKFEKSVYKTKDLIDTNLKQIVMVGKSNVGKSSFINTLANNKSLAKVGQTPGKTRSINYYNVDNKFYLVDLPGYGFSKMTKKEQLETSRLIENYINKEKNITHIFFLVDIRHKPTKNDRIMYEWLLDKEIPFDIVATKSDKIAKTKIDDYLIQITKELFAKEKIYAFSSQDKNNVDLIEKIILDKIN